MTLLSRPLNGQDYIISISSGSLAVTDVAGNGDQLDISESGDNILLQVVGRTYSFNEGPPTSFPFVHELPGITGISISAETGNDIVNLSAFTYVLPALTINGGVGDDQVNIKGDITFAAGASFNLDLQNDHPTPGSDMVIMSDTSDLMLAGTGEAIIKVSRNILIGTGCSIVTENGDLTIEANQQATPTTGAFVGVVVNEGLIQVTGSGICTVKGKGGTSTAAQYGVYLHSNGRIMGGTTGLLSVTGFGGLSSSISNYGVYVFNIGSKISSLGGDVLINGTGGGTLTSNSNHGVYVNAGGEVNTGGNGTMTIVGNGGNLTGTGGSNSGVYVNSLNVLGARISSGGNAVSITGTGGGGGTSQNNHGVFVFTTGEITSGGNGNVTIVGYGGNLVGTGGTNIGVNIQADAAKITSGGGNVFVTGYGGGASASSNNTGVNIASSGVISAGGNGNVIVEGTGGESIGSNNRGVAISNVNSIITSSGGDVTVTGYGGGSSASAIGSAGVYIFSGLISAGGNGVVNVTGFGGSGPGQINHGLFMVAASAITSSGGPVTVTGHPGINAGDIGINLTSPGTISTLNNGGNITLISDIISLASTVMTHEDHTVCLKPFSPNTNIDFGVFDDPIDGALGLSDIEINYVSAGTLVIGGSDCDTMRVSADINRAVAIDMELQCVGDIIIEGGLINTGGGSLLLHSGSAPSALWASMTGIDIIASELTISSDLGITINGNITDVEYDQLNILGAVDLTDVNLLLDGSYVPAAGDTFIIVKNDDMEMVTGTFAGLPEGTIINDFFENGMGLNAMITYTGGDGNDVKIEVIGLGPNTWLGSISSEWNDPLNWSRGIVPSYETDVLVRLSANGAVIQEDEEAYAKSLEIETGATLHVYGNLNLFDN